MLQRNSQFPVYWEVAENEKSGFVERFPELSLFFKAYSPLDSEMICIFPYFCPYAESAREIREIFIYAAGDVTDVSYKQIVIAMGEGAKAALAAFEDRMRGTIY